MLLSIVLYLVNKFGKICQRLSIITFLFGPPKQSLERFIYVLLCEFLAPALFF